MRSASGRRCRKATAQNRRQARPTGKPPDTGNPDLYSLEIRRFVSLRITYYIFSFYLYKYSYLYMYSVPKGAGGVRVSGGHLGEAEAPTEAAAETRPESPLHKTKKPRFTYFRNIQPRSSMGTFPQPLTPPPPLYRRGWRVTFPARQKSPKACQRGGRSK